MVVVVVGIGGGAEVLHGGIGRFQGSGLAPLSNDVVGTLLVPAGYAPLLVLFKG